MPRQSVAKKWINVGKTTRDKKDGKGKVVFYSNVIRRKSAKTYKGGSCRVARGIGKKTYIGPKGGAYYIGPGGKKIYCHENDVYRFRKGTKPIRKNK